MASLIIRHSPAGEGENTMLKNNLYNLMLQLTQENKSLWRIKNHYLSEAEGDAECTEFWKKLEADKEAHVAEILALVKKDLNK